MKIALVDDHEIILESLSMLLESLREVDEVQTFQNPETALKHCLAYDYDLVITDFNMPEMTGCGLALQLRKEKPNVKILMLTVNENFEAIRDAFQAGVLGYIMKKAKKAELKEAVLTVASGKRYVSDSVFSELLKTPQTEDAIDTDDQQSLSSREIEIVRLIAQEMSTKEIAEQLFVSKATIEKHRYNILRKLDVKNSIGIIKYAIRHQLLN
ncbi:response regulator [Jiulongibacter sp. NS-SX5]|uniref:response regulator n=1 Tax=Jiulongibacter sp. NS-SX5 TaxID=3463854 RepID=UPI004059A318